MPAAPPLPPEQGRLLSDMGMRRGRRTGQPTFHAGMDLGHPQGRGTPILNIQRGVVERVNRDADRSRGFGGYGNSVVVNHGDGTWGFYAHMDTTGVATGETVEPGKQLGTMGNTSNGQFPGMGVHLHIELRRAKADGSSPFPGPYRTYNLDPRPWLEGKGLRFLRRGGFEILPGSEMATTRMAWEGLGALPGVHDYYGGSGLAEFGQDEYEPPARFDRDVYFGLTPVEWVALGVGSAAVIGATGFFIWRARRAAVPNRRRRRS